MEFDKEKIDKYYNGKSTEADEDYVNDLFGNKEKEEKLKALLFRQFCELESKNDASKNMNLENILYRIHYGINTDVSSAQKLSTIGRIIKWSARIAAILILPIAIYFGIQLFNASKDKKLTWAEIKAPAWTRAKFSLPDGTTVWLNSGSSIKYNGKFITDREVILNGEALFDVFKDQKRPFKVKANEVCIVALGTKFNVASYENENKIEVVLEEGKLLFGNLEMTKFSTMYPNDMIVYDKSQKIISREVVQPNKYLSWVDGKLIFRNDPLDVIARRLERWYNIDVEILGPFSDDLRLHATFKDESLNEVLDLLQRSLKVKCQIEKRNPNSDESYNKTKVIITPKNN